MSGSHPSRDRVLDWLLYLSPLASIGGLAALFVMIAVGFEEPNQVLFFASASLLVALPLAVAVHAALTHHLTRAKRRIWLRAFVSPKAVRAMPRYLRFSKSWVTSPRRARHQLAG
jgi:hypothetical protein